MAILTRLIWKSHNVSVDAESLNNSILQFARHVEVVFELKSVRSPVKCSLHWNCVEASEPLGLQARDMGVHSVLTGYTQCFLRASFLALSIWPLALP
jgi:hypothetical protein